ncbi:hypothetical protein PpBr36_05244 [Pyricularia pennisetigena]|uniref:hypothetical protein n=1 Tax=Pyricularia pennisetigena TaxID=1578925 RepID=UPI001151D96C|nr:hypothetical protein PpBr36_05244 [Pyricularia pennisetigena]TLS26975.1 hypothetical protein PpBr36_05244 [Pyricularia pennisetigena]
MLLPSAVSCDANNGYVASSQPYRLQPAAQFASPPSSPPPTGLGLNNLFATCRSLQALLAAAPAPSTLATPPQIIPQKVAVCSNNINNGQLPSPPLTHAPSPLKLRLRPRKPASPAENNNTPSVHSVETPRRRKVVKRAPPPPPLRGANKRRRSEQDDDDVSSDSEAENHHNGEDSIMTGVLQTPKRARIAPAVVPLGLERSDFHNVHEPQPQQGRDGTEVEVEADGEEWSAEDDRILVELVLEKLRLSKEQWQDCARSMGRDKASIGRRWKSLMAHGDVGLKSNSRSRRGRIHGSWR